MRPAHGIRRPPVILRAGDHQPAGPKLQVKGLVYILELFLQHIFAHNPHIGRAIFHIGWNIRVAQQQKPDPALGDFQNKFTAVMGQRLAIEPNFF